MDLQRITQMEFFLNEINQAMQDLQDQLERLKHYREQAKALYSYYGSEDWYKDREEELPEGMRAGILGEDAQLRVTAFDMLELGMDVLKNWI